MVGSGYRFVTAARRRGVPVAIVNRGVTRGDPAAAVRVDAALAGVLGEVGARVLAARPPSSSRAVGHASD
jgi:hypothetical protein